MKNLLLFASFVALILNCSALNAATSDVSQDPADIRSAGPLAFGPDCVLFVGDPRGAAVFALETSDNTSPREKADINVSGVAGEIAAMLGTTADDILINDLAVNPVSGTVYLSVSRGRGPDSMPVIMRVHAGGEISEFTLQEVPYSKASLSNPPADAEGGEGRRGRNQRLESITDLAYVGDRLYIAGLSNEEFSSQFRSIPYPFKSMEPGTAVEIFHGSHGRLETRSPIRTFTTYDIEDAPHLLAAYTCTPLVKIPIAMLRPGKKVTGETVAELGNHNRPLDMIVYSKDGADYVLMANSARGLMKISMQDIGQIAPIVDRVPERTGLQYETITGAKGIVQLDQLDNQRAIVLVETESNGFDLKTMPLP